MPHSASEPASDDLDPLMSAVVDGTISPADLARLMTRLRGDRAARDLFRSFMEMESILAWELVKVPASAGRAGSTPSASFATRLGRAAMWLVPLVVATAAAVWLGSWRRDAAPAVAVRAPDAAVLADVKDAVWADGRGRAVGRGIAAGPLKLVAGSAQLRFRSGAVVTLNAPSEIEVLGDNRVFLRNGGIVPYVPPAAKGFTVVSPTGEVIDLGTEFAVNVDARGRTNVYVLDGEVDVAGGHAEREQPLRMTRGFGTRLTGVETTPEVTDRPYVIDDFTGHGPALRWRDVDPSRPGRVSDGRLMIPVEFRPQARQERMATQLVLDHDFSILRGRKVAISFKTTLPDAGLTEVNRWLACVVDSGSGPPPMAYDSAAELAVLVSPNFQAGVRLRGQAVWQARIFARSEDAVGPYQVLLTIDDTPAAHLAHGGAMASVTVNGQTLVSDRPIRLGERPRIGLQTFVAESNVGRGHALVDDLSVSVSADTVPHPAEAAD